MAKGKYEKWLKSENLTLLQGWRRDGLSYEQIARNIGISESTLYAWQEKHKEIAEALKKGTEVMVYEVENALFKSAIGYHTEEMEITEITDEKGDVAQTVKKKHRRYIPPSTAAQIFILKNRRPDWWRDTRNIEVKSEGQLAALIDGLKVSKDDLHEETAGIDEAVADGQAQTA